MTVFFVIIYLVNYMEKWLDMIAKLYENKLKLGSDIMKGSKREKVSSYLEILENARQKVIISKDKELEILLKSFYHDLYVIKKDKIQFKDENLTKEQIIEKKNRLINDQKYSLDKWLDFFLCSDDANTYSAWQVFWVLEGLQKLGRYDDNTKKFLKRDDTTIYPFPDINKEAVFNTVKLMEDYLKTKNGNAAIKAALGQGNFKILYEYSLEQIKEKQEKTISNEGIWIKYNQGADYRKLFKSLQGTTTGWCTAIRESFAKEHLERGDFYVFYTKDKNGKYSVPRIAIRMDGNLRIAEIKGIAQNQNIESNMLIELKNMLGNLNDGKKYFELIDDLETLAKIYNKTENGENLTMEELKFIYEIDKKIGFFGWKQDSKIEQIKSKRNVKQDLCYMLNCSENEIAESVEELNDKTLAYIGDLIYEKEDIVCPNLKYIIGSGYFSNLKTSEGLSSLTSVTGDLTFVSLRDASGLKKLKAIGGKADFELLMDSNGLSSLEYIGGDAIFSSLLSATHLIKLKTIYRNARFYSLKDARGFYNLEEIKGNAYFSSLERTEGLESLKEIGYSARFRKAKTANGFISLVSIGDDAEFPKLIDSRGFRNLRYIGGDAYFTLLKNPKGMENLVSIGDNADFPELLSLNSFSSLIRIGGDANFKSLLYWKYLKRIQIMGTATLSKPLVLIRKITRKRRK